jgi:hypothetical protein
MIVASLCLAPPSIDAQTVGTQCWTTSSGMMQCNSTNGVIYVPDQTARVAEQVGSALVQIIQLRRHREAVRQIHEQEERRQRAIAQLFSERAREVVVAVINTSTRFEGVVAQRFVAASASSLEALYLVNPMAPQSEMLEVVLPHYRRIMEDFGAFMQRNLQPYVIPIQTIGSSLSPEQQTASANELARALQALYMNRPDATAEEFQQTIEPLLAKFKTLKPRT